MTKNKNLEYVYKKNLGINWTLAWKKNPGPMYDKLREQKTGEFKIINRFVKFNTGHVVLDFGVGIGLIAECVSEVAGKVYGWDIDPLMLNYCRDMYPKIDNMEMLVPNVSLDDLHGLGINVIMANNVVSHFYSTSEFKQLLSKFSDLLPSGGLIWFDWNNSAYQKEDSMEFHPRQNHRCMSIKQIQEAVNSQQTLKTVFIADKMYCSKTLLKKI